MTEEIGFQKTIGPKRKPVSTIQKSRGGMNNQKRHNEIAGKAIDNKEQTSWLPIKKNPKDT